MKQITIQGFAYCKPTRLFEEEHPNSVDGFTYGFSAVNTSDWGEGYIHVGAATMTIEAPKDFDPRAGAVNALAAQRKKIQAEFQARITEIDRQISQYTAIEYVGAA